MLATVQVTKYIVKKYIIETPITTDTNNFKLPDIDESKFEVFESPAGSIIPATNFSPSSHIAMDKTGNKHITARSRQDTKPIAFLTIKLPAFTSSNPSEIYPPSIGT